MEKLIRYEFNCFGLSWQDSQIGRVPRDFMHMFYMRGGYEGLRWLKVHLNTLVICLINFSEEQKNKKKVRLYAPSSSAHTFKTLLFSGYKCCAVCNTGCRLAVQEAPVKAQGPAPS